MANIYSSTLASTGGTSTLTIVNITTNTSLSDWSYNFYNVDTTAGNITITLPASTSANVGKSFFIKKYSNDNNFVKIVANGTDTIEKSNQPIYLYNQNDVINLCSKNGDVSLLSDLRVLSSGSSNSFMRGVRTSTQTTGLNVNAPVVYTSVDSSYGTKISLNTSTGIITLKAGSTYNLYGSAGETRFSTSGYARFQWYNVTNSSFIGSGMGGDSAPTSAVPTEISTAIITPSVDTQVALYLNQGSNLSAYGYGSSLPWFYIEEVSRQASVINTVDNISVVKTTDTTFGGSGDIIFDKVLEGNISYSTSTGLFSLKAGKKYLLQAGCRMSSTGGITYKFVDATNADITISPVIGLAGNSSFGNNGIGFVYTPSADIQVKLRNYAGSTGTLAGGQQWVTVTQIGSTATTSVPDNLLSSNIATLTGTQTLTNKSLSDGTTFITDDSDITKKAQFQAGGITTGTTRTYNLPDSNGTMMVGTEWTDASSLVSIGVISGTAPTKATASTINARYKVIGKSLYFDYVYSSDNNTGSASGTGIYTINIASVLSAIGASINTTLAPIDTNATGGTILYPKTAPVGNGTMALNDGTNYNGGSLGVHIASATSLCMHGTAWNGSNGIATGWVSNVFYSITLQKRYVGFKCIIPLA